MAEAIKYYSSVIKSIEPKMTTNGYHRAFDGQNGKTWVFAVEMEDGTKGDTGSLSVEPRYKEGDHVKYTKKDTKKNEIWISIKEKLDDKSNTSQGNAFKSSYNDPISIRKQAMIKGCAIANLAYKVMDKQPKDAKTLQAYGVKFYDWLMKGVTSRDEMYNRDGCINLAFTVAQDQPSLKLLEAEKPLEAIMAFAEDMLIMVGSIQNKEDEQAF